MRSHRILTALGILIWLGVALTSVPRVWENEACVRPIVTTIVQAAICSETRAQLIQRITVQPLVEQIVEKSVGAVVQAAGGTRCKK